MQLKQFYTTFIDRPSFLNVSNALHAFRIFLVDNEMKGKGKCDGLATRGVWHLRCTRLVNKLLLHLNQFSIEKITIDECRSDSIRAYNLADPRLAPILKVTRTF